jgi:hypothetical protein
MDEDLVNLGEDDAAAQFEDLLDDDLETVSDDPVKKPEPDAESDEDSSEESDESSEEDSSEESDEEESEESEEGEPEGISDDTLVDIQIGEETYEVNFAELRSGYLRQEDYVAKVNAQEAEYLEKSAKVEELEAQLVQELQQASIMMTGDLSRYDRINWQALKEADPAKYNELRVEATEAKERAQAVIDRQRGIEKMHQEAQRLRQVAYIKGQVELAEKIVPGFKEPEFFDKLVAFGKDVGYTQQEIESITDARQLLILNNARLFAEGVVKKKAAMESRRPASELPPVIKPGTTKSANTAKHQQAKKASARLNSEKSVEAAAAYFMTLDDL